MFKMICKNSNSVPSVEPVRHPSYQGKIEEMAAVGKFWMITRPACKWSGASIHCSLDIETDGIGKLELKGEYFGYDKNLPIEEAVSSLYDKFLIIKKLSF